MPRLIWTGSDPVNSLVFKSHLPAKMHRDNTAMDVGSDPRFRFWLVYSYLIAYLPDTTPLQIVRVIHGSRDIGTLLSS